MVYFPLKSKPVELGCFIGPLQPVYIQVLLTNWTFVSFTNIRFPAVKWLFCDFETSNTVLRYQNQLIVAIIILLFFLQSASPSKKHYKTTKKYYKVLNCKQYFDNCTKRNFKSILTCWECEGYILWFALPANRF